LDLPPSIQEVVSLHKVVVVCSPITDLGPLQHHVDRLGSDAKVLILGMADQANRTLFHQLEQATGRHSLPQVFVDGEYAGGIQQAVARLGSMDGSMALEAEYALRSIGIVLGYASLLPLAGAALVAWGSTVAQWQLMAVTGLASYSAVMLSFFGAVHWGLALLGRWDSSYWLLMGGVVPALWAWVALLLPWPAGLALLLAGFAGLYAYERFALWSHLPLWYLHLRSRITLLTVLLVGAAALAPGIRGW